MFPLFRLHLGGSLRGQILDKSRRQHWRSLLLQVHRRNIRVIKWNRICTVEHLDWRHLLFRLIHLRPDEFLHAQRWAKSRRQQRHLIQLHRQNTRVFTYSLLRPVEPLDWRHLQFCLTCPRLSEFLHDQRLVRSEPGDLHKLSKVKTLQRGKPVQLSLGWK